MFEKNIEKCVEHEFVRYSSEDKHFIHFNPNLVKEAYICKNCSEIKYKVVDYANGNN